jgi:hypothetical protein
MIYITTFFGKNVNGGNPDADPPTVYQVSTHTHTVHCTPCQVRPNQCGAHLVHLRPQDGVKYGMYAQAGLAAVSLVYSFVLPYLVKFLGVRYGHIIRCRVLSLFPRMSLRT